MRIGMERTCCTIIIIHTELPLVSTIYHYCCCFPPHSSVSISLDCSLFLAFAYYIAAAAAAAVLNSSKYVSHCHAVQFYLFFWFCCVDVCVFWKTTLVCNARDIPSHLWADIRKYVYVCNSVSGEMRAVCEQEKNSRWKTGTYLMCKLLHHRNVNNKQRGKITMEKIYVKLCSFGERQISWTALPTTHKKRQPTIT